MNEPVEQAQKSTGKVTAKELRKVLQSLKGISISRYMHGEADVNRASWSDAFVFTMRVQKRDYKTQVETSAQIDVPGWVSNGHTSKREERKALDGKMHTSYEDAFRPLKGFWSFGDGETLLNVLALLPGDAEVALHVYLDAGTSSLLVAANAPSQYGPGDHGLHADAVYLVAKVMKRGEAHEMRFLLDSTVSAHNTARFGAPRSEEDTRGSGF